MAQYDLIIVGGGINGSAIARDAALRGFKALLIERNDFASGASGNNGRMIHGGLRYLEQAEVGLVREALREQTTLLKIAPHLVCRRDLVIPVRTGVGRPKWMVRAGLAILDVLAGRISTRHRFLSKNSALQLVPSLNPEGLLGAALMFDAFAEFAERLTIENLVDAAANGAVIVNHTKVDELVTLNRKVAGIVGTNPDGQRFEASAKIVVNATGAWGDEFLSAATGRNERLLGASKGTFIVVQPFAGAPAGSVFFEARSDKRPIIATPWNGLYLVGTTDERISGPVDDARASAEEVDYLVAELAACFPAANLTKRSVLYTYTGVRPLPFASGASKKVPRKHVVHDHEPEISGLLTIMGGKFSTFRSLAEEAVDAIARKLGHPTAGCQTAKQSLPGGRVEDLAGFAERFCKTAPFPEKSSRRLVALYGGRADAVATLARAHVDLAEVIDPETGAIGAELVFAVRQEWATTFTDILVRRTMIGRNSVLGVNTLERVSEIAARHLQWSASRIAANKQEYQRYVDFSRNVAHDPRKPVDSTGLAHPAEIH